MQLLAGIHQSDLWQQLVVNCQLPILKSYNDESAAERLPAALLESCISHSELQGLLQDQAKQQSAQQQPLQITLCFDAPELVIGRLLQQGRSVSEALANWQQQTSQLLQLQQQHRRQLQLLQTDALLQNPTAAPEWLSESVSRPAEPITASADIFVLLAGQGLRQGNQAYQLWQRLIASSLPLTEHTGLVLDLQSLQQQLTDNSKADALQSQLNASNDERDLLLQQLLHVQEELEQLFQKKQTVKQQYSQLEQDYRNEVAELSAKLQNGEQTVDKTAEQLHKFQDELSRITEAHNNAQQQLKATNDEHDLLLQQLLHVQEELEKLFLEKQALQKKYSQLEQGLRDQTASQGAKLERSEQKTAQLASELQKSQQQCSQLEQDLRNQAASLGAKLDRSEKSLEKVIGQLNEAQEKFSDITSLHYQSEQNSKQLAIQLQNAGTELEASNGERDLFQNLLLRAQEEIEHFNNDVSARLTEKNQKLQHLSSKLKALRAEQQQNEAKLAEVTADRDAQHHQLIAVQKQSQRSQAKLEQQVKLATAEMARAKQQAAALTHELTAVKSSTLWKSGAPVRKLASVLSKSERERQSIQQDAALIYTSEYFDVEWYLQTYPDVVESGMNPAEHYLRFGAREGRYPGPLFDGNWYLQRHADVAEAGLNPLLHFIKFGCAEGRAASPILLANKQQSTANVTANNSTKTKKGSKV